MRRHELVALLAAILAAGEAAGGHRDVDPGDLLPVSEKLLDLAEQREEDGPDDLDRR